MGRCNLLLLRSVLIAAVLVAAVTANPIAAVPVNGSVGVDPNNLAGVDGSGRVLLYTPNPLEPGSSVSHFDSSAFPDLLMEPSNSSGLAFQQLDLTVFQMRDIGWRGGSSTVTMRIQDAAGQGFNDPALGAQRRAAVQNALAVWASRLGSSVEINVNVAFESLECGNGTGVLAQAGARFLFESFAGAPVPGTWYHGALAESLSGQNLSLEDDTNPNSGDLSLTFNSQIDSACLGAGSRYYYGLNGNVPANQISFVNVALHELGHGLGFSTFANSSTGGLFLGQPDIYSRFIFDNTRGTTWNNLTNGQRQASAINSGRVAWSGNQVRSQASNFLSGRPALTITAPASIAGAYTAGVANFGPPLATPGLSGALVEAFDGTSSPRLLCSPAVNGSEIAGKIALVDRGTCNFTVKVKNAQNAGAIAVVIANNVAGDPPGMNGDDNTIVIPSISLSQSDGALIRATLAEIADPGTLAFDAATFTVDEAAGTATVTVRRGGGTDGTVRVDVVTSDGSATAGDDYQAAAGGVTFNDGQGGTRTFGLTILDDFDTEGDETIGLTLANPTGGATLGTPNEAVLSIIDDDLNPAGAIAFTAAVFQVNEGGGNAAITVERQGGTLGAVSVDVATGGGSATAGEDYQTVMTTVAFADGEGGTKAFDVPIFDDDLEELLETFGVALSNPAGGVVLATPSSTMVEIFDNEPCQPSQTRLCLNQGRFAAEVAWRDFAGNTGSGQVEPLDSDDSGLLWFFDSDNLEMLVKVLDGCSITNHFWVFAAATTDVEYTLTVTDKMTGATSVYTNPLGVSSAAITDTEAFATCPGGATSEIVSGDTEPDSAAASEASRWRDLATQASLEQIARFDTRLTKQGACQADNTHLCLNQGRFQVEIQWIDFVGQEGPGQVEPLASDDSGLFWFFDPNNLEALVKVLNGCDINNRYWVFAAATTNVGYTLTVTDTLNGEVRRFTNPLGVASAAITDTDAFMTCP